MLRGKIHDDVPVRLHAIPACMPEHPRCDVQCTHERKGREPVEGMLAGCPSFPEKQYSEEQSMREEDE